MIQDFLKNFKKEWFMDKILEFGRKGLMTEKQFYAMVGFVHPGSGSASVFLGEEPRLQERFKKNVQELPEALVGGEDRVRSLPEPLEHTDYPHPRSP